MLLSTNPLAAWLDDNCLLDPEAKTQIGHREELGRGEFAHADSRLYPNSNSRLKIIINKIIESYYFIAGAFRNVRWGIS
jgi:hypothetical protein